MGGLSPSTSMVVEVLGAVYQLLFWLKTIDYSKYCFPTCVKGHISFLFKNNTFYRKSFSKESHQRYELSSFDSSNRLQTAGCGKGPATSTASLWCKLKKKKKSILWDSNIFIVWSWQQIFSSPGEEKGRRRINPRWSIRNWTWTLKSRL